MLTRQLRFVPVVGLLTLLVSPSLTSAQAPNAPYVESQLIVKLRDAQADALARAGAPVADPSARLQALLDRFDLLEARALRGVPRTVQPGQRARLTARSARLRGSSATDVAEKALDALSRVVVVELPAGEDVEQMASALSADPAVEYAHPNYIAEAFFTPDDPFWSTAGSWGQVEDDLWGLKLLETEQAWDVNQGAGVVVAVVDSGVDFGHPDLVDNAWINVGHGSFPPEIPDNGIDEDQNGYIDDVNGFDFVRSVDGNGDGDYNDPEDTIEPEPFDGYGHGTHVSGTIAAVGNNGMGVIGVAPQVQIMGVRGLGTGGSGTFEDLAAGLVYAALNGADVINNSWGCGFCPSIPLIEDAVRLAHDLGVVVVFAAGNLNDHAVRRSPQNMSETVTVSALTATDEKTYFTSYGPLVDVGAPGGGEQNVPGIQDSQYNVLSLRVPGSTLDNAYPHVVVPPGGDYFRLAGTSMASPHAAGVAALLRAHDPTLRNEQIRQILRAASDPIVTASPFLGYGRVNARKVLESILNVELLIETPTVESREIDEPLQVSGYARGPNLQNVQVSIGAGEAPTQFLAMPTTWNAITGGVTATVDASELPDGFAVLRVEADDGSQTYASSTGVQVNNVQILAPEVDEVVQGGIDVVIDLGTSPFLERVVVTYFNRFTNQNETLLDTTTIPPSPLTIPLDTTASIDTSEIFFFQGSVTVQTHFDVNGDIVVSTDSVNFDIDNDRITSPTRASLTADPSPFNVDGTVLHDLAELQVHDGSSWVTLASLSSGPFSVPFDPAAFVDLDASNLVVLRLLADIDGDMVLSDNEQNELMQLYIDTALAPGWPQQFSEPVPSVSVTLGDLDGDGDDELVAVPDGTPIEINFFGLSFAHDPDALIHVYDGSGTLNTAVATGSDQFQDPVCQTHAALHDLDGLPGKELIWTSYGQIAALRHDGTPPAGFAPEVFNAGLPNSAAHADPDYTELFPCRPSTPFTSNAGDLRILQGTRHFDSGSTFDQNKVLLFDATGAVVNEVDRGPGRVQGPYWAVADLDFAAELGPEIVTTRKELLGPNGEQDSALLVYDAITLALEAETPLNQMSFAAPPVVGNVDGDADLEIVVFVSAHPPIGQTGTNTPTLLAFHHDGTPVVGFSRTATAFGPMALADVDGDGAAEIALFQNDGSGTQLALLDYDSVGQQLLDAPGWPVSIPNATFSILLADVDDEPTLEVLYLSPAFWTSTLGASSVTSFQHYGISALDLDGTPWQGGWQRWLRGPALAMAIGNLDAGPGPELAVGYPIFTTLQEVGNPDFLRGEVLVYAMDGVFSQTRAPWSHVYGNAQQSGATPTQCQDGVDNDGDGPIDGADPQCTGPLDPAEVCGLGPELIVVLPPLYWLSRRRTARRNA